MVELVTFFETNKKPFSTILWMKNGEMAARTFCDSEEDQAREIALHNTTGTVKNSFTGFLIVPSE